MGKIRAKARFIASTTKTDTPIKGPDHDFIKDVLSYHKNSEDKLQGLDHFQISHFSESDYSKCFFAVKKDNTKEVDYY